MFKKLARIAAAFAASTLFACSSGERGRLAENTATGNGAPIGNGTPTSPNPDSSIRFDDGTVLGSLDKVVIRDVIHRNRQQIQYCYEIQLAKHAGLAGKLAVAFVIGPDGKVQQAHVARSTLNDPELEQCVADRFKSWTFPKPKGGGIVQVTYPVVLRPRPDGG
jgi:TonB family protein